MSEALEIVQIELHQAQMVSAEAQGKADCANATERLAGGAMAEGLRRAGDLLTPVALQEMVFQDGETERPPPYLAFR
jgi:hypothetical protein